MANLTSSISKFMDTITDKETGETIILPNLQSLEVPNKPNYVGGQRRNINSFGTEDISSFDGDGTTLIQHIGADFNAEKTPAYRRLTVLENGIPVDKFIEVPNNFFVERTDTHQILGNNVTSTYSIFDFRDAAMYYFSILEQLKNKGYQITPAFAKIWENGARLFIQHKIGGGQVMGEPVDSYLSLITSHDKSSGFVLALSTVRLFCSNQIHRMLKNASMRMVLRHTTNNGARIEAEAAQMIAMEKANRAALEEYAQSLAMTKITDANLFNAFAKYKALDKMTTQRQVNNFEYLAGNLMACYNMPDVANYRGTALGAYYAASDAFQHVEPLRNSKTRDQKMIEASLDGNVELGVFTDTVVQMAR